jgi:hypothetical protein
MLRMRKRLQVEQGSGGYGTQPAASGVTGDARANTILHRKARKSLISGELIQFGARDIHALPWGFWSVPPHPHPIVLSPLQAISPFPATSALLRSAFVLRVPFAVGAAGEDRIEKFGGGRKRLIDVSFGLRLPSPVVERARASS